MKGLLFASLALSLQHVRAHPASTHSQSLAKRTVDLDSFRLKVAAEYVNSTAVDTGVVPTIERRGSSPEDTAIKLVKRIAKGAEFRLVESYTGDNGVTHFYFKQTANGVDIDNGDFNVNVSLYVQFTLGAIPNFT
jgi:extracellular elastinolytic metalloproteinase